MLLTSDIFSLIEGAKDAVKLFTLGACESFMKETSNKCQYSVNYLARSSGCKFSIRYDLLKE